MDRSTPYHSHDRCLLSGAQDLKVLKGYEKDHLVRSSSSGFVFCSRIPERKELEDHYKDYPRSTELSNLRLKRYSVLLDEFEKFRSTNRIIDVGCGNGLFLAEAKKRGWNVYGTEFTSDAVERCQSQGIQMKQGPLTLDDMLLEGFDIVTSFEVIEHINNPLEESLNFKALLRKGGLLYVTTPNFNCIERYVLGSKYDVIEYPEHLCYYTAHTLRALFKAQGFKAHRIEAVNIDFSKFRKGKIGLESNMAEESSLRDNIESNPLLLALKNTLNTILNLFKVGNALKGWFIKK